MFLRNAADIFKRLAPLGDLKYKIPLNASCFSIPIEILNFIAIRPAAPLAGRGGHIASSLLAAFFSPWPVCFSVAKNILMLSPPIRVYRVINHKVCFLGFVFYISRLSVLNAYFNVHLRVIVAVVVM